MRLSFLPAFSVLVLPVALAAHPVAAVSSDQGAVERLPVASGLPANWARGPFLEIYVRGFRDSNGDGKGDLQGVIDKLDYVRDLGFTGIWLMPVFDSEDHNHGYAVRNFRQIEKAYGSEDDLRALIAAAHQRGIGILLDYTANQAASEHAIFQASTDPASPYRDWFVWSQDKPDGWSGFNGEPWHERNGGWYYGVYDTIMPDWNWRNPQVMEFHLNNLRYWLNRGVDGFRLDAVDPLVENGPQAWRNQPETLAILKRFGDELRAYPGTHYQVCEAPMEPALFARDDACGSAFAFGLQKYILRSANLGRVDRDLPGWLEQNDVGRMGTFLNNHDTFAGTRLFNQLDGDLGAYRMAAATLYLLPGIPFTLYGEEIGMSLASSAGGTDEQIRAPLPWSAAERAIAGDGTALVSFGGFSEVPAGRERRLFRPLPDNWKQFNVAAQIGQPGSLLEFYRALIALRRSHPALAEGTYQRRDVVATTGAGKKTNPADTVFAFERAAAGERLLVVLNYGRSAQRLRIKGIQGALQRVTGAGDSTAGGITMPAQSFAVFRLPEVR